MARTIGQIQQAHILTLTIQHFHQGPITINYDIDDDATSVCYDIEIYDDDDSADELLDYVSGSGSYYTFTQNNLTSSFSTTHSYDNTGSSESYRAGFEMDVYIYLSV